MPGFCGYASDARYGWAARCLEQLGSVPQQILDEWNTVAHVTEFEGQPHRRPLTYDEVQALFDAADGRVEEIRSRGRKSALAAQRDAALLKTVYAFGLRRREAWGLDLADLRHNPQVRQFAHYGAVFVRWGKSSNGSPPKRRTVLTVPEMDWVVAVLQQWTEEVRPLFSPGAHPALWVTERRGRLSRRAINEAFEEARGAAGLDPVLDLHCLRDLYHAPDRVRLPGAVRARPGRSLLCEHDGDLHGCVGRVPEPPYGQDAARTLRGPAGGEAVTKKMGIRWHLRLRMAEKGLFQTSDLVPLLAERGVHLSREQVYRLVTQVPQRLSTDTLAALCDILGCQPNDLIEVEVVSRQVRKAAGEADRAVPPPVRRSTIRRPDLS